MMSSLVIAGLLIRVAREAHEADIVAITEQPVPPRRHRPGGRRRRHEQKQPVVNTVTKRSPKPVARPAMPTNMPKPGRKLTRKPGRRRTRSL